MALYHFKMLNHFSAPCVSDVQQAIEHIYPLVYQFRKERTKEDEILLAQKGCKRKVACVQSEDSEESDGSCE